MDARYLDESTQLRELIDRCLARLNTGIPGIVESFNAALRVVTVTPAIQMLVNIDGDISLLNLPPIVKAPIELPYCLVAGFYITLPIRQGDPCWIKFSQRAIDNWFDHVTSSSGPQPPETMVGCRHHDLTDAVVTFAPATLQDVLENWESAGIEIRNRAKTSRVTVKDDSVTIQAGAAILVINSDGSVSLTAPNGMTITAPTTTIDGLLVAGGTVINGTLSAAGNISAPSFSEP